MSNYAAGKNQETAGQYALAVILIEKDIPAAQAGKVKISRAEVRAILLQTAWRAPSRRLLAGYWAAEKMKTT